MNFHSGRVYFNFNFPGSLNGSKTLITGIREDKGKNIYIITGFYEFPSNSYPPISFLYKGYLDGTGKWNILNYPGNNIYQTNLYGPSTTKKCKIYNIVGNYTIIDQNSTIGCFYHGELDGKGEWKTIIPSTLTSDTIINTICHSTMGNLIVGNFDTNIKTGRAFLYSIKSQKYVEILNEDSISITAYGVWKNCKNNYTICGGIATIDGEKGYTVNYIGSRLVNWKYYSFNNNPEKYIVTHFDGISIFNKCKTLTGDYIEFGSPPKAFFCKIDKAHKNKAEWEQIEFDNSDNTSGNSVSKDIVIGVYLKDNTVNGYVSLKVNCKN